MNAAVVTEFGSAPRYQEFPTPVPSDPDEMLVDVLAAGLHPRVRSQAAGSHYTSTGELPLVPGIDGVGRGPDGRLRYFVLPDTTTGALAERTVVDARRSIVLPVGSDAVALAAGMNPGMSAWIALRRRIAFTPGQHVLVLGATGNAGRMAVQIASLLGAGGVIAAGRNERRLAELTTRGATGTVRLDDTAQLGVTAAEVDVVLDYVWGAPTAAAMAAVVTARADRGRPLTWIQIGSVAGLTAEIPSAALRATPLQIVGSGQGSVGAREIVAELPALAELITANALDVDARAVPLAEVENVWADRSDGRVVLIP